MRSVWWRAGARLSLPIGAYPLLDRAARYFPLERLLTEKVGTGGVVLEVGSGPFGLGWFIRRPFVGCDVRFELPPVPPLVPVAASAAALPFRGHSFDAVVLSDVLEHVAPPLRMDVVGEALRVSRRLVLLGFPCGARAQALDRELADEYVRRTGACPVWLEEHLRFGLPDGAFENLGDDLAVRAQGNESLGFHAWMMRRQARFGWRLLFRAAVVVAPNAVARLLRRADRPPYYRRIVVIEKRRGVSRGRGAR